MTAVSEKRKALKAIFTGTDIVQFASVFGPLSGRLAEMAGFRAGFMGGSAVSAELHAAPDVGLLKAAEIADCARRSAEAVGFPILVDGDDGYGNAVSTVWTVRTIEDSGAAGVTIEDSVLPTAGGKSGARVISLADFAGKLGAAVAARRDPDFVVVGQTVAYPLSGLDDTVARLHAMKAAGVDAAMVYGLDTPEALRAIAAAVDLPLFLAPIKPSLNEAALLGESRVRGIFHGHQPLRAAAKAMHDAYAALLAENGPEGAAALGLDAKGFKAALARADRDEVLKRIAGGN